MQLVLFVALLFSSLLATEAIFAGGLGLLALGALKLKALALLGRRRRRRKGHKKRFRKHHHKRSVDSDEDLFLRASLDDVQDCGKKLVCVLNARRLEDLEDDERSLAAMFAVDDELEFESGAAEFDLAALVGRRVGVDQCESLYARCQMQSQQLMQVVRTPALLNQL